MSRKEADRQWVDYVQAISDDDRTALLIAILDYLLDMGVDSDVQYTPDTWPEYDDDLGSEECFYWAACGEPIVEAKRVK